jgi:transcriptional regulator with XRE-family HTH domain
LPNASAPDTFQLVKMFDLVGETLRRLRKERDLTLEELRLAAGLGRGQLSRIENRKQEATLTTLAKILECQGVSRREFFRRYELVESEAQALERQRSGGSGAKTAETEWPEEIQDVLQKVDSFARIALDKSRSVAQGAVEIGDLVVLFRVMPKEAASSATAAGEITAEPARSRRAARAKGSGSRPERPGGSRASKRKR